VTKETTIEAIKTSYLLDEDMLDTDDVISALEDLADRHYTNDAGINIFVMPTEILEVNDFGWTTSFRARSVCEKSENEIVVDYLSANHDFDLDQYPTLSDYAMSFDIEIKSTLTVAAEKSEDVRIWREVFYTQGSYTNQISGTLRDERDVMTFSTTKDAQDYIDKENEGNYYLSSGEYGRPDFLIYES